MTIIKFYRILQVILLTLLFTFLIYFNYPILHIVCIGALTIGLIIVTKIRETAIGMFIAATNDHLISLIRSPLIAVRKMEEEEEENPFGDDVFTGESGEA